MDLIERENQEIYLDSCGYNQTQKYKSTNISDFLSKMERFLNQKQYGFCIPTHISCTRDAYFNIEPHVSIKDTMNGIKDYFDNLTSTLRKDKFEYLLFGCFFYNKRNQIIWQIQYMNPIIQNRLKILDAISIIRSEYNYYSFSNKELSETEKEEIKTIKNTAANLLRYKISNHKSTWFDTEEEFKKQKAIFRSKSITEELKYENIKNYHNFYKHIIDLLNLQTEYEK